MDNYLFTISTAHNPDFSEKCKDGQKVPQEVTSRRAALPIPFRVLLIILFIVLVALPCNDMAASCAKECCNDSVQGETHKCCCKASCSSDTVNSGIEKAQPGQTQRYKDIKCFNACVKSGYRCKYCEDTCSYCK